MAGPLMLAALLSQDMYLAGAFILILSVLTVDRHADLGHSAGVARSAHPHEQGGLTHGTIERCTGWRRRRGSAPRPRPTRRSTSPRQWQLMWWRFTQHRVALASGIVVLLIYVVAMFPEFLAPDPSDIVNAPLRCTRRRSRSICSRTDAGLRFAPHVDGYRSVVDAAAAGGPSPRTTSQTDLRCGSVRAGRAVQAARR